MKNTYEVGDRIRTTCESGPQDWNNPSIRVYAKWGVDGEIVDISSGHGRCYKVRHADTSQCWYNPSEITLASKEVKLKLDSREHGYALKEALIDLIDGVGEGASPKIVEDLILRISEAIS